MYSQNKEDEIIGLYFKDKGGSKYTVLDIGANDGMTFSNSLALIQNGWSGVLLEPSISAFERLKKLHAKNIRVLCRNYGISIHSGLLQFWENQSYEEGGNDVSLLSTTIENELNRWGDKVKFELKQAEFKTWIEFRREFPNKTFQCISIDTEGNDLDILRMIDLAEVGCELLCIEYNSLPEVAEKMTAYCEGFGLKEIHRNAENIIFAR